MNNLRVRWGATLQLQLTVDEDGAETAKLILRESGANVNALEKTVNFVDGVADLTLSEEDTQLDIGTYEYMIIVTYDDGTVEKYPDPVDCSGDCELPVIEICESLDHLEVS